MLIDSHTHVGRDRINFYSNTLPKGQTAKELVRKLEENNIEKAIIFPCPSPLYYDPASAKNFDKRLEPSGLDNFPYHQENLEILKAAEKYQDKLIPYLAIDPHNEKHIKSVEDLVNKNSNIRGFKFHGWGLHTKTTDLIGSKLMEIAEDNGLVVLVHSDATNSFDGYSKKYADPMYAVELAKSYPNVNIIVAHLGLLDNDFLEALSSQKNLYTDTGPFFAILEKIRRYSDSYSHFDINCKNPSEILVELNRKFPRKILWSTDEPWTIVAQVEYKNEADILHSLPDKTKCEIAEENICKVVGIDI